MPKKIETEALEDTQQTMQEEENIVESEAAEGSGISGQIVLEGKLGIADVKNLHLKLSEVLLAQVDICIQAEDLNRVDGAVVQLLYAFIKQVKSNATVFQWLSVSESLREAAQTLGLSDGMCFEKA